MSGTQLYALTVLALVIAGWFAFAGVFLFRKQAPRSPDYKRDPGSNYGLALQGLSFAVVWVGHRVPLNSFVPQDRMLTLTFGAVAVALAALSVIIAKSAVKALGKEWSLTARVIEDHQLATTGPYRFVRHPIYTSMFCLLLATGFAVSRWPALFVAVIVFLLGTAIRVSREERLLQETFGTEFDNYSRRLPAVIPGIW